MFVLVLVVFIEIKCKWFTTGGGGIFVSDFGLFLETLAVHWTLFLHKSPMEV